ncbi:serine hydrolase [Nocardiopsis algeriensis]|uniref:Beta-lactamase class A n=1 Tax=Nocardiopsis algeriensis TaxID=1478215 RepID=A0A841ITU0_9ACTN|nr:beta-lactamase class A [Nocardiopsis algeriensis]
MPRRSSTAAALSTAATAVALCLAMLLGLSGASSAAGVPEPAPEAAVAFAPPMPLPAEPVAAPGSSVLTSAQRDRLADRVDAAGEGTGARYAIAVQDLRTGTAFSHNCQEQFATASVSKLLILAMLHLHAQEEGRELTEGELWQVEQMIRYSDNEVTNGLYARIGYNPGFTEAAARFGLTGTDPHPRAVWGGTLTTACDQIRLLRALYTDEGPLTADNRAHIRGLMESVAPEQAWGVSAAASEGDTVGLKNGWTPRESDGGLWAINSVGYVAGPDREYLVAVLSDGHAGYGPGIDLAEELIGAVTGAMEEPAEIP